MSGNFRMDDYVDVAERIRQFKELYPEGTLQTVSIEWRDNLVVVTAAAYRTPDDERPGIGTASEPVPGKTPYTRDSELMNAETSAWGRAIVAIGIPTKRIASANEVESRQHDRQTTRDEQAETPHPLRNDPDGNGHISKTQGQRLHEMLYAKGRDTKWFLGVLHEKKGIGDGEHLSALPSEHYESILKIVRDFKDPEPQGAPAEEPTPEAQQAESGDESAAEAADTSDDLDDADRAFLEETDKTNQADPDWGVVRKKGTVAPGQLTRLGALCSDLERLGVGTTEWRRYFWVEEKVQSRQELTKAAATRMIDALHRWVTDLESGVAVA